MNTETVYNNIPKPEKKTVRIFLCHIKNSCINMNCLNLS